MLVNTKEKVGEFVEMLVKEIAENPDAVQVNVLDPQGKDLYVEVSADAKDYGQIIGKSGRTIKAIRTLTRAVASDMDYRIEIELLSEDE